MVKLINIPTGIRKINTQNNSPKMAIVCSVDCLSFGCPKNRRFSEQKMGPLKGNFSMNDAFKRWTFYAFKKKASCIVEKLKSFVSNCLIRLKSVC